MQFFQWSLPFRNSFCEIEFLKPVCSKNNFRLCLLCDRNVALNLLSIKWFFYISHNLAATFVGLFDQNPESFSLIWKVVNFSLGTRGEQQSSDIGSSATQMPHADQAGNAQDARIPGMLKEVTTIHQLKVVVASSGYLSSHEAVR